MYRLKLLMLGSIIAIFSCISFSIIVPYKFVKVVSSSMEPTLHSGELIIYNPFFDLSRGDIIVFRSNNDNSKILVKRIIGIPGDSIDINSSGIYINSQLYMEGEIQSLKTCYNVPQETVFVMGDNYKVSIDSRNWEEPYVKKQDILGVVL